MSGGITTDGGGACKRCNNGTRAIDVPTAAAAELECPSRRWTSPEAFGAASE